MRVEYAPLANEHYPNGTFATCPVPRNWWQHLYYTVDNVAKIVIAITARDTAGHKEAKGGSTLRMFNHIKGRIYYLIFIPPTKAEVAYNRQWALGDSHRKFSGQGCL